MCGIAGIVNLNGAPASEDMLQTMMFKMKHRGPNDKGAFTDDNISIGQVRLSIIDLSSYGHQPMFNTNKRYAIVFNGEIYNYLELREELKDKYNFTTATDTEVILAAYEHWGEECINRFNGMWAFAIYDTKQRSLFISRDRYGVKPLYYYQDEDSFVFASEIKALHAVLKNKLSIDNNTIFEYLVYNRTDQTCNTFVKEIKRVQHGYNVYIKEKEVKQKKWYDLNNKLDTPWQNPEEYFDVFSSAVGLRLRSDVPVGVCLSGGLDSSSVTSVILDKYHRKDLFAFSAVYGENIHGDESRFINEYKAMPNLTYIYPTAETFIEDFDDFMDCHFEPVHTMSIYSQFKVMKEASKYVTVALDGQGADEQLAGYHYFFSSYFRELLKQFRWLKFMNETAAYYKEHDSLFALKYMGFYMLPDALKSYAGAKQNGSINANFFKANNKNSSLSKLLYDPKSLNESLLQHFEYKLEHNLKWNDLNSMYFSVELREPFLDYRLVEKTLASPSHHKINKGYTKWIFREAMKGVLPESIRLRQDKVGFDNPSDEWLKTKAMQSIIYSTLNSDTLKQSGFLNIAECEKRYQMHLKGELSISKEIWKWINLNHFLIRFNKEKVK
jgi:asparagine synthase (glutamine-hydrolysing)